MENKDELVHELADELANILFERLKSHNDEQIGCILEKTKIKVIEKKNIEQQINIEIDKIECCWMHC